MKRTLLAGLLAAALIWSLSACAPAAEPEDEGPTLPSISKEQTPLEQLEAAIAKTHSAGPCKLRYGVMHKVGEETTEESFSQSGEINWQKLYGEVPNFPDNPALIRNFCSLPLRVIPSNTGTIRYQLTDLTRQELERLVYAQPRDEEATAVCALVMDVDADGRLFYFEMSMETEQETVTVFLSVIFPESP